MTATRDLKKDMTIVDVVVDVLISVVLIVGAWITNEMGEKLFPSGLPFPLQLILLARDLATFLWAIGITARYFQFAYSELNKSIQYVLASKMWKIGNGMFAFGASLARNFWHELDNFSRQLVVLILVVLLSFWVFNLDGKIYDLIVPPLYWASCFGISYVVQSIKRVALSKRYWLVVILIFLVLEISILLISGIYDINVRIGLDNIVRFRVNLSVLEQIRLLLTGAIALMIFNDLILSNYKWLSLLKKRFQVWFYNNNKMIYILAF